MSAEREHALLSASSAERWLNCTPSARLSENVPETTSEYAEKGTLAHAIAELKLRKYAITPMGMRKFNAELKKLQDSPAYEVDMLAGTDMYLDHIKSIYTGYSSKNRPTVYAEHKVNYGHIAPDGFGTADCIIIGGGDLHVVDYKNGSGVQVSAENNSQLKLYALGALREFGLLHSVERVHLTIVQPNNGGINSWDTTPDALYEWAEEIKPIAQVANAGEGECKTGDWCRFCPVLVTCSAQHTDFSMFNDLTATSPTEMPPDEIGRLLNQVETVADWMTKLREYALSQIIAGVKIPGWKSVEGQSRRAWTDQDKAFEAIKAGGIDEAILYERKPLTLAAVEKAVGKPTFDELAGQFINRPAGAPTLAHETDRRPAFTGRTPEQVFQNVEVSLL